MIIRIDSDRKLAEGAYGELQGGVARWFRSGTQVEIHGKGVDGTHKYVYGTADGVCVRFYEQTRYSNNAYRIAGLPNPSAAEFEARFQQLQKQFDTLPIVFVR